MLLHALHIFSSGKPSLMLTFSTFRNTCGTFYTSRHFSDSGHSVTSFMVGLGQGDWGAKERTDPSLPLPFAGAPGRQIEEEGEERGRHIYQVMLYCSESKGHKGVCAGCSSFHSWNLPHSIPLHLLLSLLLKAADSPSKERFRGHLCVEKLSTISLGTPSCPLLAG